MKSGYVVDASVILANMLPDETLPTHVDTIINAFNQGETVFYAPQILYFEVTNTLSVAVRRNRLSQFTATKLTQAFIDAQISIEVTDFPKTLRLALKHNLSIYDAAYLELSRRLRVPLLSLDTQLAALGQRN
jgi:predicted nucleic acid-binding protein